MKTKHPAVALLLMAWVSTASAAGKGDEWIGNLREMLLNSATIIEVQQNAQGLANIRSAIIREVRGNPSYVELHLKEPSPALAFCKHLGWNRPYAYSSDVHQNNWWMELWEADLKDPHGVRIALESPKIGRWRIRLALSGQPSGELPKTSAGASPAYDLRRYKADIVYLEIGLEE